MASKKSETTDFRKYVKWFWILVLSGPLLLIIAIYAAKWGLLGELPSTDEIANPKSYLASQIISQDGQQIGTFFEENRTHAEFSDLSPNLVNALVATEDERFYDHSGVDLYALGRAIAKLGKDGGGSTLTQQLAKQLFHEQPTSKIERLTQKLKEWVISTRLEKNYTKEEIIAMYLNQFDFLYQAVGINSAARIYFDKTPDSLRIEEAAVLVGMVKNPALFNPMRDSTRMFNRRNTVIGQLARNGFITEEQEDSLCKLPMIVKFSRQGHDEGIAPYLREYLRGYMRNWIENHPKPDGSKYNMYTDGLKIYTTIDSRMQRYAEEAMREHMSNLQRVFDKENKKSKYSAFHFQAGNTKEQADALVDRAMKQTDRYRHAKEQGLSAEEIEKEFNTPVKMKIFSWQGDIDTVMSPRDSIFYYKKFYQAGLLSVEPQTGFIKAWVGGIDFKNFKYDHVKQGKRQVGSTFKPFVYATAIDQKHYSPCMEVPNIVTCIEKGQFGLLEDWCPKNSDNEYGNVVTLKYALANSMNTVTTYLMKQIGPEPVIRLAQRMGVHSEIPVQPSIALGTVDLSVYEMVGSYTTFANKGIYTEPIVVTRIEDKNGVVLEEFSPLTREVISEEIAYVVTNLLCGVTQGGTGTRLRNGPRYYTDNAVTGHPYQFTNEIGGKTGTTQNQSDGWFMGMVPNLITGVWTGCDDRAVHFRGIDLGQGATTALPIWALYMRKCYADPKLKVSKENFERPAGPISIELNCAAFNAKQNSGNVDNDSEPEF